MMMLLGPGVAKPAKAKATIGKTASKLVMVAGIVGKNCRQVIDLRYKHKQSRNLLIWF